MRMRHQASPYCPFTEGEQRRNGNGASMCPAKSRERIMARLVVLLRRYGANAWIAAIGAVAAERPATLPEISAMPTKVPDM